MPPHPLTCSIRLTPYDWTHTLLRLSQAGVQLVPSGDAAAGDVAERTGTIVGIVDGSYQVLIDGSGGGESAGGAGVGADGETVAVAPADVILPSGTVIFVAGLQGAPEFNGEQGKILSHFHLGHLLGGHVAYIPCFSYRIHS